MRGTCLAIDASVSRINGLFKGVVRGWIKQMQAGLLGKNLRGRRKGVFSKSLVGPSESLTLILYQASIEVSEIQERFTVPQIP
jgi:hypothetical protein